MIEIRITDLPYYCRTKDILWFSETRTVIELLVMEGKSIEDIKELSDRENLFNAASPSRAKEIRQAIARRVSAVNEKYLRSFLQQNSSMQKILCMVMLMLTDRTFYEFMDNIYREKLITGNIVLKDSDLIGFLHEVQTKDVKAAKWTDAGMRKIRTNYKQILKDAGLLTEELNDRMLIRPILSPTVNVLLKEEGLESFRKIIVGER